MKAIQDGAESRDFFGYAIGQDSGRYLGLNFGQRPPSVLLDDSTLIVRKEVADAASPVPSSEPGTPPTRTPGGPKQPTTPEPGASPPPAPTVMSRFYGSVRLNELKVTSGAGRIAEEVVKHLAGLVGADVEVVLEIRATVRGGIPDSVVRTVSENARTLKFQAFEFEEE